MKKKIDYLDLILKIIIGLLGILVIYWLIQLIFGGSPGLSEFNLAIIIMMATLLFKIYREMGEVNTGIKHNFSGIKNGFENIKNDMTLIKDDMLLVKKKIKIK